MLEALIGMTAVRHGNERVVGIGKQSTNGVGLSRFHGLQHQLRVGKELGRGRSVAEGIAPGDALFHHLRRQPVQQNIRRRRNFHALHKASGHVVISRQRRDHKNRPAGLEGVGALFNGTAPLQPQGLDLRN